MEALPRTAAPCSPPPRSARPRPRRWNVNVRDGGYLLWSEIPSKRIAL